MFLFLHLVPGSDSAWAGAAVGTATEAEIADAATEEEEEPPFVEATD